jgi:hypothetical protein
VRKGWMQPIIGVDVIDGIRTVAKGYVQDGIVTFTQIYSEAYDQRPKAYIEALERELYG